MNRKGMSSMYHLVCFVLIDADRETKCKISIFISSIPECWQKMGLWHCLRRHRILRRVGYKTSLRIGLAWSGRGRYPRQLNLRVLRLWSLCRNSPCLERRPMNHPVSQLKLGHRRRYTYHAWFESRLILPLQKFAPVNVWEEMVRLDFCGSVGA